MDKYLFKKLFNRHELKINDHYEPFNDDLRWKLATRSHIKVQEQLITTT